MDKDIIAQSMVVYCATNKINGKKYVGQTINRLSARIKAHKYESKKNKKRFEGVVFYDAIREYGFDSFEWEVLQVCESKEGLLSAEIHFVEHLNTHFPNGYNVTSGGGGSSGLPENVAQRRADKLNYSYATTDRAQRVSKALVGITRSAETRRKMSDSAMGKEISKDQRAKAAVNTKKQFENEDHRKAHAERI